MNIDGTILITTTTLWVISTHTKIGTPHEKTHYHTNESVFADSAFSNITANFCQCLPSIVNKLLTRDTYQNLGEAYVGISKNF